MEVREAAESTSASASQISSSSDQMAASTEEQSATSEQIARSVQSISAAAQESAAGVTQVAGAAEDLDGLTDRLRANVEQFDLGEGAGGEKSHAGRGDSEGQGDPEAPPRRPPPRRPPVRLGTTEVTGIRPARPLCSISSAESLLFYVPAPECVDRRWRIYLQRQEVYLQKRRP